MKLARSPEFLFTAGLGATGLCLLSFLLAVMLLSSGTSTARTQTRERPLVRLADITPQPFPMPSVAAQPAAAADVHQQRSRAAALTRIQRAGLPVYCGGGRRRLVALTFDDGPGDQVGRLLGELRAGGAHATFFNVGRVAQAHPKAVRWEAADNETGDHSWGHEWLGPLSFSADVANLKENETVLRRLSKQPVALIRPPYGSRSPNLDAAVHASGLTEVLWSVDTRDWAAANEQQILDVLRANVRPGSIILMHETHPLSVATVPSVLRLLAQRHLTAVTVSTLLAADPPSLQQLRVGESACFRTPG